MRSYHLSKSRILAGIQCPKQLYLKTYHPEYAEESSSLQGIFTAGNRVGELARRYYPQGRLIGEDHGLEGALRETAAALATPGNGVLFDAAVEHGSVLVRTDVLEKRPDGVRVVEVKSASRVTDHHVYDCAIQSWVLRQAGYRLACIELAYVDNSFVYRGDNDYHGLLKHVDMTGEVRSLQEQVVRWVSEFTRILAGPPPQVRVGRHCKKPHVCAFLPYCTHTQRAYLVTALPNGGDIVDTLLQEGIEAILAIPEGRLSDKLQQRVRRVTQAQQAELDEDAGEQLRQLPYPRYYLDFETVAPAIPIWPGTRPYQSLPFQWSCHIESDSGELTHASFLDTTGEPPMRPLAEKLLLTLTDSGPVFTYTNFEKNVIEGLADMLPDLADDLRALTSRVVDLHKLTRDNYYHPDMLGSWSLKAVVATVALDLRYDALDEVREGVAATTAYRDIIDPATNAERRERLIGALLDYCELYTHALVRLARFFQGQ
jgi:hypothetical protein